MDPHVKSPLKRSDPSPQNYCQTIIKKSALQKKKIRKKCDEDDFVMYHDYHYGNCFRFNGNKSNVIKTKKSDWKNGLRLELFVGDPDEQQQFTYKAGIRVIVHNQTDSVFSDENGIDVSVGSQTNIGITRTMIKRRPYPYSNCIDNYQSKQILQRNTFMKIIAARYPQMNKYSQIFCLKTCLQEFLINKCGCFDLSLPRPDNSSINCTGCETTDDLNCVQLQESQFYESEIEKCYSFCPNECFQVLYETKVSSAKYPSKWYASILKNSTNLFHQLTKYDFEQMQQMILMVNVFYEQMNYNLIEEYPELSIDALLAFIGGNLGLFLGISVLSLVEIIEFGIYLVYFFMAKLLQFNKLAANKTKVEFMQK
ncbi:degenerin deg-1-like [Brachionus plicatilis]|uniref:Degenerin deg-1-like n=1 Tax=Brachionus plicatilis TaxID=10195 RepID=A0A3M7QHR3_BRAPC|nr:degenerin deg-1-like [Brachionus plicatilis]